MERRKHTQGFGLIELLISLFIFSISLLGLKQSIVTSLRYVQDAYVTNLVQSELTNTAEKFYGQSTLSPSDVTLWAERIKQRVPHGEASVLPTKQGFSLKVNWLNRTILFAGKENRVQMELEI